ncbi:MAG TPA: hypothetical protein VI322_02160 [Candidatus Saccharimonadia bacterium]
MAPTTISVHGRNRVRQLATELRQLAPLQSCSNYLYNTVRFERDWSFNTLTFQGIDGSGLECLLKAAITIVKTMDGPAVAHVTIPATPLPPTDQTNLFSLVQEVLREHEVTAMRTITDPRPNR